MNCEKWSCSSLKWFIYWMQSVPGKDNGLTYKGNSLPNWWTFIGDFDESLKKGLKLVPETPNKAPIANSQSVTTNKNISLSITLTGM